MSKNLTKLKQTIPLDKGFDPVGALIKAKNLQDLQNVATQINEFVGMLKEDSDKYSKISVEAVLESGLLAGIKVNGLIIETEEEAKTRLTNQFLERKAAKKAKIKRNELLSSAIESSFDDEDDDY